jgi:hypothetical protein
MLIAKRLGQLRLREEWLPRLWRTERPKQHTQHLLISPRILEFHTKSLTADDQQGILTHNL